MATLADPHHDETPRYRGYMTDQPWFLRFALVLSALIVLGFAQFSARGFVDWRTVPGIFHVHALAMLCWLGVFITQNVAVGRGNMKLHRTLGWMSIALVIVVVALGCRMGIVALRAGMIPPYFTPGFFLALTQVSALAFGGTVFAAIVRRHETEYHRRLMLGAVVLIAEPAIDRLLPMPLMGNWGHWAGLGVQIAILMVLALHDRKVLGRIHPATLSSTGIIAIAHVLVTVSGSNPEISAFARSIAAGG